MANPPPACVQDVHKNRLIEEEDEDEIFELPPGCEMSVRFRKDQIDKASKDTSGRFVASLYFLGIMFLLTLLWRR